MRKISGLYRSNTSLHAGGRPERFGNARGPVVLDALMLENAETKSVAKESAKFSQSEMSNEMDLC